MKSCCTLWIYQLRKSSFIDTPSSGSNPIRTSLSMKLCYATLVLSSLIGSFKFNKWPIRVLKIIVAYFFVFRIGPWSRPGKMMNKNVVQACKSGFLAFYLNLYARECTYNNLLPQSPPPQTPVLIFIQKLLILYFSFLVTLVCLRISNQ